MRSIPVWLQFYLSENFAVLLELNSVEIEKYQSEFKYE